MIERQVSTLRVLRTLATAALLLAGPSASAQNGFDSPYEPQVFQGLPVRVMKPLGFDTKQQYPVIVSLHGAGGRGTGNNKQLSSWNRQLAEDARRKDFPCYVVAPQAEELWNAGHFSKIKQLVQTLPSVDRDRIYIMGHSMGGHGTYLFIQLDNEYFAAAAPSAGSGKRSTKNFIDPAKIKGIPIWAFHGDKDRTCPFEKDQIVFNEMKRLGGNMKLTTWVGDSHGVSGKMIPGARNGTTAFSSNRCDKESDFMTWLFSQSRRQGNPKTSPSAGQATKLASGVLASGEYFITQSWSQETNFKRSYFVRVPEQKGLDGVARKRLPVLVFLHGNGGQASQAMMGFVRQRRTIASRYITVFAQGYRESWNIVAERSKADDRGFIETVVKELANFENVDANDFTIMGSSNGAAMVNQLAIESRLPNIRNYISGVSPLNTLQYDGKHFNAKGEDNDYRVVANPLRGKRLLNISGTRDNLVPYDGGTSRAIPAKRGKLAFVGAEESTFVWARQMGYSGKKLTNPTSTQGNVEVFSYLDGDVVHCKVNNEGHGATQGIPERVLLKFLEDEDVDQQK